MMNRDRTGCKLFMLLPRMLLQRPGWGGVAPKKIQERLTALAAGRWAVLVHESMVMMRRKRRREGDNLVKRAARVEKLVHLGELSAGRQALEGTEVAPGTLRTLREAPRIASRAFTGGHRCICSDIVVRS